MLITIFLCILGGMVFGFTIAAMLSANKYDRYSREFLFKELIDFKHYWMDSLELEHDKKLAKDIIEDFQLGLLNEFRRD